MRQTVTIVGGGVCALMLGCELDPEKFEVCIYEKNAAPGRKFLVAGDGGLNLTHSEIEAEFIKRYTPFEFLEPAFNHFSNSALIQWLNVNGIKTFVGSSKRVFPEKGIKPIDVLTTFLKILKNKNVLLKGKHEWKGLSENNHLIFKQGDQLTDIKSDYVIFCLGGASWPVTGSTGDWKNYFLEKKIRVNEFKASNCVFKVEWNEELISKTEGTILKNCTITCNHKTHAGEIVITRFGLEGSGIYPLSPQIRKQLLQDGKATVSIDLKPSVTAERLLEKLKTKIGKAGFTAHIKKELNLSDTQIRLLKHFLSKEEFLDPSTLCRHIKNLAVTITDLGPIEDAISTVGGISLEEIDDHFELKRLPRHFTLGEMLDYDAPTGGYLLQSCFSMAKFLANHLNNYENFS